MAAEPSPKRRFLTMYYKKTGYIGIRQAGAGGKQLLQVGKKGVTRDTLQKAADQLVQMLEQGQDPAAVKTYWSNVLMLEV